jgi:hypothetical protein
MQSEKVDKTVQTNEDLNLYEKMFAEYKKSLEKVETMSESSMKQSNKSI